MARRRTEEDGRVLILIIIAAIYVLYLLVQFFLALFRFIWSLLLTENIWINFIIIWGILSLIILRIKVFHKDINVTMDSVRGRWIIAGIIGGFLVPMNIVFLGDVIGFSISKIPFITLMFFAFIVYLGCTPLITRADDKAKKHLEYLKTVPGLFDTAKSLSAQANTLFHQNKHLEALQTYENAESHFTRAHVGAKAINDTQLVDPISNNLSMLQKNITVCNNAIGADIAVIARNKFEKGDFIGAIKKYEESLKYSQDPEFITKTRANIERCYIEIDTKKVEELSNLAASLLKEVAGLNEPFKSRDILKEADNLIDEAVTLAKKRNFTDALSQLNTISKYPCPSKHYQ